MKKTIYLTLLSGCILFASGAYSQDSFVEQRKSVVFDKPNGPEFKHLIESDEGFISVRRKDDGLFLTAYKADMTEDKSVKINIKSGSGKIWFKGLLKTVNCFYILTILNNEGAKRYDFYTQKVNKDLTHEPKQLLFSESNTSGSLWEQFGVVSNGTMVYFFYRIPGQDKENSSCHLVVYNSSLEQQWDCKIENNEFRKHLTADDESIKIIPESYKMSDEGNGLIIAKIQKKKGTYQKDQQDYYYRLYTTKEKGQKVSSYAIDLKDKFSDTYIARWKGEMVYFTCGVHFEASVNPQKPNKTITKYGAYIVGINTSENILYEPVFHESGWDKEFKLTDMVITDKYIYTFGERFYMTMDMDNEVRGQLLHDGIYGNEKIRPQAYFISDTIYINSYSIDENITYQWTRTIYKSQIAGNSLDVPLYLSYGYTNHSGNLYFVYNSQLNDIEYEINKPFVKVTTMNTKKSATCVYAVKLDNEGFQTKEIVYCLDEIDGLLTCPKMSLVKDNDDMVLYARRKDKYCFVALEFKK
ncbi:MAG: hypothetical protein HY738_17675 [Bacteroidia bacterium]|nr:hypothetical protein [Bacteroidia bacterium]